MSHLDTGALKERAQHAEPSIALLLIVVVGASLRLWRLGTSRLNYDESFTAMTGRMPFAGLVTHLRIADSHPPLDYLLRAPLARAGVSDTFVRLPSALCSIAALVLFAWWMRTYGRAGVFAVVLMALSAFQIAHGREARMYAELQLIGVATAVLVDTWLRAPHRRHPFVAGTLTALALLTHVSGMLLVAGLPLVPGRRRDRDAWRWRAAVELGAFVWAALWGPSFLVQARGGHSQWIQHSTASRGRRRRARRPPAVGNRRRRCCVRSRSRRHDARRTSRGERHERTDPDSRAFPAVHPTGYTGPSESGA